MQYLLTKVMSTMRTLQYLFLVAALLLSDSATAGRLKVFLGRHTLPPPVPRRDALAVTEKWLSQKLDHYDPMTAVTWQQKYFENTQYYKANGPAFLFIGGEGSATSGWLQGGQMMNLASKYGAMAFELEHRFYGESYPTPNISTANLWYLRTEQALADLAYFIQAMNAEHGLEEAKWVVFGGSYAGNLAAWMRLKYPHLVHGAVSSSGPLLAKTDFFEYYEVVAASLGDSNQQCVEDIKNATIEIQTLMQTTSGAAQVTELFNICDPLADAVPNDIYTFYETLAGMFASAVQYNTRDIIGDLCQQVTDPQYGSTPLLRYAALATSITGCNDIKYDHMIEWFKNETWEGDVSGGMRPWLYQTCTEYGYYQTSNSDKQPFGDGFQLQFFIDMCASLFGNNFNQLLVDEGVKRTNMLYGGNKPDITNVVFVNGAVDPWHALGVLQDLSPEAQSIFMIGTSHCADMYDSSLSDPPQMTAAKAKIDQLVGEWIEQ